MIGRTNVTGLVLAGGRGSRMGGVDKGLELLGGEPLVQHAIRRLAPQVGPMMINANRNRERYEAFGLPVVADADASFSGPLAGFVAGLANCATDWLVTVPCDTPRFPVDLVERLARAIVTAGTAQGAVATTIEGGRRQRQSVFCLIRRDARSGIEAYLAGGGRKIEGWFERAGFLDVVFEETDAFYNANTIEELRKLGPA